MGNHGTGIDVADLRDVIRTSCNMLGLGGEPVEELLLATAMQESGCGARLTQMGGGPALGVWQMEPATHDDIWKNFLAFRAPLHASVAQLILPGIGRTEQLKGNLYYACAMARVQYYRSPRPIPSLGDLEGYAELYKLVFNSNLGAATIEEFVGNARIVLGLPG